MDSTIWLNTIEHEKYKNKEKINKKNWFRIFYDCFFLNMWKHIHQLKFHYYIVAQMRCK